MSVATGLILECFSFTNMSSVSPTFNVSATFKVPSDGSIASDNTTISVSISIGSLRRVSSNLTTIFSPFLVISPGLPLISLIPLDCTCLK